MEGHREVPLGLICCRNLEQVHQKSAVCQGERAVEGIDPPGQHKCGVP